MPKKRHKTLLLLLIITITAVVASVSADDADIMANFAKSINSPPSTWTGSNFCKWQGVNCDSSNRVSSINLQSKSLSGKLPPEINQLSGLKSLSLQRNQFSGPAPALSNMTSLEQVNLDENSFDSIPTGFLSGLTSLQSFSMNNNTKLPGWTIPDSLKDSTSLTGFYASKSNIVGQIPDIFGSLPNFQTLKVSYNNLTGSLPASFSNSTIQGLYLNNQGTGLSGPIDVLGTMSSLQVAWLHANRFSGGIPDLSRCTELSDIQLRDNSLTGPIPDSLTKLPKLKNAALQSNRFQGPVPSFGQGVDANLGNENSFCLSTPGPCATQVTVLLAIASAMNYPMTLAESWEGNDPCNKWQSITCEKGNVVVINFAKQNWTGTISPAYANLTGLKTLLLNDNRLEGPIPDALTHLRQLQTLDVSNNNVSGKVPNFPSSVSLRTSGNSFIGKNVPLSPPAETNTNAASKGQNGGGNATGGDEKSSKKSRVSPWVIVLSTALGVSVMSLLVFLVYKRYSNNKTKRYKWVGKVGSNDSSHNSTSHIINHLDEEDYAGKPPASAPTSGALSMMDKSDYQVYDGGNIAIPIGVLKASTDNFNDSNIIGKGGFGVVYKGQLSDGKRIAVKRMETSMITDKGLHEFNAEIEVLTKVRHRHLVALLGFCDNGNERLLVYEYMPLGHLGEHLFQWEEMGVLPLSWNQRVVIALDVARGVEYLHSLAQQSFIHRDLKPSNILLGDDKRAKVSDFGLVRSAPDGNCSIETRLAGTFGYLAPEYAATGRVTTKVDVYAFGVILMEIITGRKAIDDSLPDEQAHLVTWFRRFVPDKEAARAAVDPTIASSMDEEIFNNVWKVAELAGHCTAREPYQRPDMSHAVNVLSILVDQWRPAPAEEDSFRAEEQISLPQVLQNWKESDTSSSMVSTSFYKGSSSGYGTKSSNSSGNRPL